jgi:carotenoid cleavage dioxygenase-like enzyme
VREKIAGLVDQLTDLLHHPDFDGDGWSVDVSIRDDGDEPYLYVEVKHRGVLVANALEDLRQLLIRQQPGEAQSFIWAVRDAVDAAERVLCGNVGEC